MRSFSSSTLAHVVENGMKTSNIVCNMSTAINSLAHPINIGDICRAPITRTFLMSCKNCTDERTLYKIISCL